MCACAKLLQSCPTLCDPIDLQTLQPARLLCPYDSPGKNNGLGLDFLLQGILLTQGSLAGRFFTASATWEARLPSCQLPTHGAFTVISTQADAAQPRYHTYFHCKSYEVSVRYMASTTVPGSLNKSFHPHILLITCILKRML